MNYFIECRNILTKTDLGIMNSDLVTVGHINFLKNQEYQIEIIDLKTAKKYFVKSQPLRLKGRFIIYNEQKEQVAKISMGVKIIHSIIERGTYHFVKATLLKIKYQIYDNREVTNTLKIVRRDKKRYFEIMSKNDDFVNIISLFLLARAVRIKALLG